MSVPVPPQDPSQTTDTPLLAGRYRLLDALGQGGMGAVFRAFDSTLSRHVAVKLLPADKLTDTDAVARFRREAMALARLSHANIVQAFDSGQTCGQHFLVMELVEGRSLAIVLAGEGKIAPTRAADFGCQIARALHYAHTSGLVHRDVKPSNMLLTSEGAVKLLDLGLARFLQDQIGDVAMTQAGAGMGTPDYCAPEQFRNAHSADPRADVYSLGCTLYHLISGQVPFPGSSLSEKMKAHEGREAPPLGDLCADVPAGLALAVGRMMAKQPDNRFQSMAEVAEALGPYVAASSPSFRALSETATWQGSQLTTTMIRRTGARRRPWVVLAGACAALVLLAAVAAGGWVKGWFHAPEVGAARSDLEREKTEEAASGEPNATPSKKDSAPLKEEPGVLTVSQKPEDRGKYRSIAEALQNVRPHQTIRIVDDGVYQESVMFSRNSEHEGVTLEAPAGAVLKSPAGTLNLITITNVRGVKLRDLHLVGRGEDAVLVFVTGKCSDINIARIDFGPSPGNGRIIGIDTGDLPAGADRDTPVLLVSNCRFVKTFAGIKITGISTTQEAYQGTVPVHAVAVRDSVFLDCVSGVIMIGELQKLQVVGNRFRGCSRTAWQLEQVLTASKDILVANNTAVDCALFFRCWDEKVRSRGVRICNNLSLGAAYPDTLAIDSGGTPDIRRGFLDGIRYTNRWTFDHNWREVTIPEKKPADPDGWIPGGKLDVLKAKIDGLNRDPRSKGFLRPVKGSPLATQGAGVTESALPSYIGALPPEGEPLWDWDRTWRAKSAK